MKVYILYSNPYDDGAEIYGAFSTNERAERALGVFSEVSNKELFISELELDVLEKYFEKAKSGYHLYLGYKSSSLANWKITRSGIDVFLEEKIPTSNVSDWGSHCWGQAWARNEKEALEIIEKICLEKGENYYKWEK